MASRGIGMLLASSKGLKKSDNKLVLLNPQPLVDAALRTMKIDRVLPIAYDFETRVRIRKALLRRRPPSRARKLSSLVLSPRRRQPLRCPQ